MAAYVLAMKFDKTSPAMVLTYFSRNISTAAPEGTSSFNSSPPGQNDRLIAEDIFKRIFMNENFFIMIKIWMKIFLNLQLAITQHWFR